MTLVSTLVFSLLRLTPTIPSTRWLPRCSKPRADRFITSQFALAEADYLILDRLGVDAEAAFLDDLVAGTFLADCLDREELRAARDLARRYRDLELGMADASLLVLAARHRTVRIATLDRTDFLAVRPLYGKAFELLPE